MSTGVRHKTLSSTALLLTGCPFSFKLQVWEKKKYLFLDGNNLFKFKMYTKCMRPFEEVCLVIQQSSNQYHLDLLLPFDLA